MLRLSLLCAWVAVCACGRLDSSGDATASKQTPVASKPAPAANAAIDSDDPLAGAWWILLPKFPIRAFHVNLEAGQNGQPRGGTWVSFDWRGTTESETLQRSSKPVRIEARSEGTHLVLEGPEPMLTDDGQPNGHSGRWHLELRRSELPGEAPRWSGTAVHDGELTGLQGVTADMDRNFRRWQ